jgi:hypothetical protein
VFPRRGPEAGGSLLRIYGENLIEFGTPSVTVGGNSCELVESNTNSRIACRLPIGSGKADVIVSSGAQTVAFIDGYRFIRGRE